jgi:hypothetical protein
VAAQLRQVAGAAAVMAAAPGPVVAVGDFNATPFSAVTRAFARDSGLARVSALPSWPSFVGLPQVAIDHIFVSPGIGAGRVRLGGPGGSDHYPVIADLVLPPNWADGYRGLNRRSESLINFAPKLMVWGGFPAFRAGPSNDRGKPALISPLNRAFGSGVE